jgi:hypothetical protein
LLLSLLAQDSESLPLRASLDETVPLAPDRSGRQELSS